MLNEVELSVVGNPEGWVVASADDLNLKLLPLLLLQPLHPEVVSEVVSVDEVAETLETEDMTEADSTMTAEEEEEGSEVALVVVVVEASVDVMTMVADLEVVVDTEVLGLAAGAVDSTMDRHPTAHLEDKGMDHLTEEDLEVEVDTEVHLKEGMVLHQDIRATMATEASSVTDHGMDLVGSTTGILNDYGIDKIFVAWYSMWAGCCNFLFYLR